MLCPDPLESLLPGWRHRRPPNLPCYIHELSVFRGVGPQSHHRIRMGRLVHERSQCFAVLPDGDGVEPPAQELRVKGVADDAVCPSKLFLNRPSPAEEFPPRSGAGQGQKGGESEVFPLGVHRCEELPSGTDHAENRDN